MADCFPPAPINPINSILLGVFGDNYFPPYNTGFQPTNRADMANEKLLQIQTPGGGKLKPTGDPVSRHISEIMSPVTGALGLVFAFFAPLYIILDLIRAIIDIICAFFNPVPVIAAVVELFVTVVPPIIALYPPLSSILHALNTAKVVTAIVVSLTTSIVAIIDTIVENALSIPDLISEGNIDTIEAVTTKICVLIEQFANELGGFAPISFIIELLELFMSLGSKFFCATDAVCCNPEACPPIIFDPPRGNGTIVFQRQGLNLCDILCPLKSVLDGPPGPEPIVVFPEPIVFPDEPITIPLGDIPDEVNARLDDISDFFSNFTSLLPGVEIPDLSVELPDDITIPQLEIPAITIGPLDLLPFVSEEDLESFVIIQELMTVQLIDRERPGQPNEPITNIAELNNFIVEPEKIPGAASEEDPATIRVQLTNKATGATVLGRANLAGPNFINVVSDAFPVGTEVEYEVVPDKISLLKLSLIGLACEDDVREAAGGVQTVFADAVGPDVLDPLVARVGNFPPIPLDQYNECLARQQADPTISQAQCVADVSNGYLDDIKQFVLDLVCIGSNRVVSDFEVNRQFAAADGQDAITVTLTVRDSNGVNLLEDFLPNANIPEDYGVQFVTTRGSVGPVIFDTENSNFRANITSETIGKGELTATFFVSGEPCMVPGVSDGFSVFDKVIDIEFVRPGGTFPRRRRRRPHIQAAGGRRR